MTKREPTTPGRKSARPSGRWLYVLPALLLVVAAWTWQAGADPLHDTPGTSNNGSAGATADDFPAEPLDPADQRRYHDVEPGFVEDSGTGIRLPAVPGLSPAEVFAKATDDELTAAEKAASAAAASKWAREAGKTRLQFPDDLRYGIGPRPSGITVDSIGVKTWITAIGLDPNRALRVPHRADIVGWWSGGSVPGEVGPTVLVGHFDSKTRAGVFQHLEDLKVSDLVVVSQTDGSTYTYFVTEVEKLKKSAFPTERVYGRTKESTLRLVTCGGKFDRSTGHYVDNTVVYAELLSFVPSPYRPTTTIAVTSSTSTAPTSTSPTISTAPTAVNPTIVTPTATSVVPTREQRRQTPTLVPLPPTPTPLPTPLPTTSTTTPVDAPTIPPSLAVPTAPSLPASTQPAPTSPPVPSTISPEVAPTSTLAPDPATSTVPIFQ